MDFAYTRHQQLRRQQQSQQSLRQQRMHQGQRHNNNNSNSNSNSNIMNNNSATFANASSPVRNISSILAVSSPVKSASASPVKVIRDNKTTQQSTSKCSVCSTIVSSSSNGLRETFISLALLCFVSLFTAFLSLIFLQKTCSLSSAGNIFTSVSGETSNHHHNHHSNHHHPSSQLSSSSSINDVTSTRVSSVEDTEYIKVTQICVSLSTITVSLNLCCVFVSCIQFLSGAKLLKTPQGTRRTIDFFKKTSNCRLVAISAFALSIPIFFTGLVLFVFVNFDEVAAITTSFAIALGIIFCGVSCVQTVYLWQDAKTKSVSQLTEESISLNNSPLNSTMKLELSTLV